MNLSAFRLFVITLSAVAFGALAVSQTATQKATIPPRKQSATAQPANLTWAELQKLKKHVADLEARLVAAENKNKSQDESIAKKEDRLVAGPDYAGGGWCTKQVFLTTLDPNKTLIRYVSVK